MIPSANEFRPLLRTVQDDLCPICGIALLAGGPLSIDHVLPKSLGGADRLGNFLLVHQACNNLKGNRLPTGCECVWLLAVNCQLGTEPQRW